MKKYLLTLCMTMLSFVTSWAQGSGSDYKLDISLEPIYVEVNDAQGTSSREFTVTAPTSSFTVEAKLEGTNSGLVTAAITLGADNKYTVKLTPTAEKKIGIASVEIIVKEGGVEKANSGGIEVNVYDMTKARFLANPGNKNIVKGQTLQIPINVLPATSTLTVDGPTSGPITYSFDATTATLSVTAAADATEGSVATFTIKPKEGSTDREGNDVPDVSFTVTVQKPELPVEGVVYYDVLKVGQEYPCPLHIADASLEGKYTYSFSLETVPGYNDVITVDENTGLLIAKNVGKAKARATFTPKTEIGEQYREWSYAFDFMVLPADYHITLNPTLVDGSTTSWNANPTVTLVPEDATKLEEEDYNIVYTLEGEIPGSASVDPVTGVVTLSNANVSQTFYVVATLSPVDDRTNYVGTMAKAAIKYTSAQYPGAYLKMMDAEGKKWVAYLSSPEQTYIYKDDAAREAGTPDIIAKFTMVDTDGTEYHVETASEKEKANELLMKFKNAKDIKVMGNINSFNIEQLVHAVGVKADGNAFVALNNIEDGVTLDFSGATMVGPFNTNSDGKFIGVPCKTSELENYNGYNYKSGDYARNLTNVTKLVLPKPDPNYTVLPAGFNKLYTDENTNNKSNIMSLTIPEGWTEIADGFSSVQGGIWGATPNAKLTELKLPNSMQKIGAYAFSGFNVAVLTMPYYIDRINEGAFATSPNLQDVYFTGPAPRFVHTLAFSGVTQMCNNTVHDSQISGVKDPTITRYEYYNGTNPRVLACLLHFPKQYKAQYIDETRIYKMLPKGSTYQKGWHQYVPEGWTPAVIADVRAKKIDYNAYVSDKVDYGVRDQFYGYDMIWPSQNQMSTGFAFAQAGYQWNGQPLRAADQYQPGAMYTDASSIDRRGLYQFIVFMANADINFEFEQDKWYTIALPFNMSVDEIKTVFGNDTQVCRFSKVTRKTDGDKKQIKLEFRKSVMNDLVGKTDQSGSSLDGTDYSDYVNPHKGETGPDDYYTGTKQGILHHFPYMIKPSGTTPNQYIYHNGEGKWVFNGSGFERLSGTLHPETRYANGVTSGVKYLFSPILNEAAIQENSYILVDKDGTHKYAFYKGRKATSLDSPVIDPDKKNDYEMNGDYVIEKSTSNYVYEPGGIARQNTAYVQLSAADGKQELTDFFGGPNAPATFGAKSVQTFFADDEDDATEIEEVVIVCGNDDVENSKIYTVSGQAVSGSQLPAGIYIKNGKKILIK